MIEKIEVRRTLNEYLKTIRTRKQITRDTSDQLLENCSTPLLQQIARNSPEYQILKARSQVYSEIVDDIFNLLDAFEEDE